MDEYLKNNHNILYTIKFNDTGYVTNAWLSSIRKGDIIDPLYPRVRGIGYLGLDYNECRKNDHDLYNTLKSRWLSIIRRCYSEDSDVYDFYGGIGVRVDDRWHNFSNFFKDAQKLPGYNRTEVIASRLHIDKDKLQMNIPRSERLYSKDTCCWLTPKENIRLSFYDRK